MKLKYMVLLLFFLIFAPFAKAEFQTMVSYPITSNSICKSTQVTFYDDFRLISNSSFGQLMQGLQKFLGSTFSTYSVGYHLELPGDLGVWNSVSGPPSIINVTFSLHGVHYIKNGNVSNDIQNYVVNQIWSSGSYPVGAMLYYDNFSYFPGDSVLLVYCVIFNDTINSNVFENQSGLMPFGFQRLLISTYDGGTDCSNQQFENAQQNLNQSSGFVSSMTGFVDGIQPIFSIISEVWFVIYWILLIGIIIGIVFGSMWLILWIYHLVRNSLA